MFKFLDVRGWTLAILDVNLCQRIDIGRFAGCRRGIGCGCVLGLFESGTAGSRIAVSP